MAVDAKILEKIQACLRLSKSAEPHEAALALQRASEMMAKYNVSLETVEVGPVGVEPLRSVASAALAKSWEARLMVGIADAFGCKVTFARGSPAWRTNQERYATYGFVGPSADAKVAHYAATVLQREMQRARVRFVDRLPEYMSKGEKTREVDAYLWAWVGSVLKQVEQLKPNPTRDAAIEKYMAQDMGLDPNSRAKQQHRGGGSHASAMAGHEDGETVRLHRPVEQGADERPRQLGAGR